jgi:hypothetical protein
MGSMRRRELRRFKSRSTRMSPLSKISINRKYNLNLKFKAVMICVGKAHLSLIPVCYGAPAMTNGVGHSRPLQLSANAVAVCLTPRPPTRPARTSVVK